MRKAHVPPANPQAGGARLILPIQPHALQLRANSAEGYTHLGNALGAQGRVKEAAAAFRRAIELQPDAALAYINLGGVLLGLKNVDYFL